MTASFEYPASSGTFYTTTASLFYVNGAGRVFFTNSTGTADVDLYVTGQTVFIRVEDANNTGSSSVDVEVTSPNDPERSQFSHGIVGTRFAHTKILPIPDGGSVIGVAGVTRADRNGILTRTLSNLHMRGYRIGDTIHLPDHF